MSILKNSPETDVFLKMSTAIQDLGHLSAGYLLAGEIDPQHNRMNNYLPLFFETNTISSSVLYGLQVNSSERKWITK